MKVKITEIALCIFFIGIVLIGVKLNGGGDAKPEGFKRLIETEYGSAFRQIRRDCECGAKLMVPYFGMDEGKDYGSYKYICLHCNREYSYAWLEQEWEHVDPNDLSIEELRQIERELTSEIAAVKVLSGEELSAREQEVLAGIAEMRKQLGLNEVKE